MQDLSSMNMSLLTSVVKVYLHIFGIEHGLAWCSLSCSSGSILFVYDFLIALKLIMDNYLLE